MTADIIHIFDKQPHLTPEGRAHLIQRLTDLAIEIALLESEKQRIEQRLQMQKGGA